MKRAPDKVRQYLWVVVKVFVLCITGWFVYHKISVASNQLTHGIFSPWSFGFNGILYGISFVLIAFLNWFFEIIKWKTLVQVIQPISFPEAAKQSLYALTVSLATPNRIGEYGAKALFFEPTNRKKVLLLTFFSSTTQMATTIFFGLIGLIFMSRKFVLSINKTHLFWFFFGFILLLIIGFIFRKQQLVIKGLSVKGVYDKLTGFPKEIWYKTLMYSIVRYLIFSSLFYLILQFYGVTLPVTVGFSIIFTMYLLSSVVPSFFIFDVVVRSGVAIGLFGLAGVSEIPVTATVLTMWVLNFVFPSMLGGYYLFTYHPLQK